jgi:putative PIN family toxin of toxin-antitoxin system
MRQRIVIDTNVYVSRLLKPMSVPGRTVENAWGKAMTLVSSATWTELRIVLQRKKFAPYIPSGAIEPYLAQIWNLAEHIDIPFPIRACRDPRDDKFLEVAVHGRADLILTGDTDLLALHPFRGIAILTPAEYLERSKPRRRHVILKTS